MKSSVKVGSLLGIPIEINYTWLLIFALITWTLASSYFPYYHPDVPSSHVWIASVSSTLLLFFSILLHELAHSFIALRNRLKIKKITLFIFGGVAQMENDPDTPIVEFKMAIAGPLCSIMLSVLFFTAARLTEINHVTAIITSVLNYVSLINLSIAIFNMIPGFPLDGGRLFRSTLWHFDHDLKLSTKVASNIGKFFSYAFILIGLVYLIFSQLISGVWFMVIGFFLHEAAELSYQQLVLKKTMVGTPVSDVMVKDIITVMPDIKLDKLVEEYFLKFRHLGFPVVEKGYLKGIVTLQNVNKVPRDKWPESTVSNVMTEVRDDLLCCPEDDTLEALVRVTKSGLAKLLIVKNGKLLGMISQHDLVKLFELKENLCKFK